MVEPGDTLGPAVSETREAGTARKPTIEGVHGAEVHDVGPLLGEPHVHVPQRRFGPLETAQCGEGTGPVRSIREHTGPLPTLAGEPPSCAYPAGITEVTASPSRWSDRVA